MKHLGRTALLLVSIALGTLPGRAGDRCVHVATLDWEPYIGERLVANGFGGALLREAFRRAGCEVDFTFMPWVRALKDVELGKYDAVGFGYRSAARQATYIYSVPYAESVLGFARLRGSDAAFDSLEDLAPYRIGVVRGFVNTPEFDSLENLHKEEVKNERMNVKKLLNGRVDLIVIDEFILQHLLQTQFPDRVGDVEFLEPPLAVHPLHLMFTRQRASSASLVHDFDRAIEAMQADGTSATIMKRFGYAHGQ